LTDIYLDEGFTLGVHGVFGDDTGLVETPRMDDEVSAVVTVERNEV
jgi:hypothetical protein